MIFAFDIDNVLVDTTPMLDAIRQKECYRTEIEEFIIHDDGYPMENRYACSLEILNRT